jgi:rRNA maturation protein Nop10
VTTIRANCPGCGDVQLDADDLTVRMCADTQQGSYTFQCPACGGAVAKAASARIVELLVGSGVRMDVWRLPAELGEPRHGPPLTPDDLLDFHELLDGDRWEADLAAAQRRSEQH